MLGLTGLHAVPKATGGCGRPAAIPGPPGALSRTGERQPPRAGVCADMEQLRLTSRARAIALGLIRTAPAAIPHAAATCFGSHAAGTAAATTGSASTAASCGAGRRFAMPRSWRPASSARCGKSALRLRSAVPSRRLQQRQNKWPSRRGPGGPSFDRSVAGIERSCPLGAESGRGVACSARDYRITTRAVVRCG